MIYVPYEGMKDEIMTIIEILPELDIGGVERHVIDLSNELAARGHDVTVISAGGKMQSQLSAAVRHIDMPVHKKNPFTIWACSRKIAALARREARSSSTRTLASPRGLRAGRRRARASRTS